MFCRNCGKELIGTPEICPNCGAKPMSATSFCPNCGAPTTALTEICMKCGARIVRAVAEEFSSKSRLAATLLAFFIGDFGAHRFYLRKWGTAIVMLLLGIFGSIFVGVGLLDEHDLFIWIGLTLLIGVGIWAFVDFIFAVSGHMKDREGKLIKKW